MFTVIDFGKLTDWIGLGLGIPAVVVAVVSLWQLRKSSQERAHELKALNGMAEQIARSADASNAMVAEMQAQLKEFQKQTTLLFDNNSLVRKEIEMKERAHRNSILPTFREHSAQPHVENVGGINKNVSVELILDSIGSTLTWDSVEEVPASPEASTIFTTIESSRMVGMVIPTGEAIKLRCFLKEPLTNVSRIPAFKIVVLFQDVEGNKYSQTFEKREGKFHGSYGLGAPVLIG